MRFLIADDHALFADGFVLLIQQLFSGVQCLCVHDFDGLLNHPSAHNIDLLFLDLHMPDMHGVHSIGLLQKTFPSLPICLISADENRTHLEYILRTGISGFVPKSIQASALKLAIGTILRGEVYLPWQAIPQYTLPHAINSSMIQAEQITFLTPRQMQILPLLVDGRPIKIISQHLGIKESTLRTHIKFIFKALEARNRTEAVNKARKLGLVD